MQAQQEVEAPELKLILPPVLSRIAKKNYQNIDCVLPWVLRMNISPPSHHLSLLEFVRDSCCSEDQKKKESVVPH